MRAHISLTHETNYGKPVKPQPNIGAVSLAIDYDGTTARQFWVDPFTRSANGVERRDRSLINIYDSKGVPVFSGDFDQLTAQLNRGKL